MWARSRRPPQGFLLGMLLAFFLPTTLKARLHQYRSRDAGSGRLGLQLPEMPVGTKKPFRATKEGAYFATTTSFIPANIAGFVQLTGLVPATTEGGNPEESLKVSMGIGAAAVLVICACTASVWHMNHVNRMKAAYSSIHDGEPSYTSSSTTSPDDLSADSSTNRELESRMERFERRLQLQKEALERREQVDSTPSSSDGYTQDNSTIGGGTAHETGGGGKQRWFSDIDESSIDGRR